MIAIGKIENLLKDIKYSYLFKKSFCHVTLLGTWAGGGEFTTRSIEPIL